MTQEPAQPLSDTEREALELEALGAAQDKPISPAARRALQEAAARRAALPPQRDENGSDTHEHGGPRGLEPTRFGDWERKGLAVDF